MAAKNTEEKKTTRRSTRAKKAEDKKVIAKAKEVKEEVVEVPTQQEEKTVEAPTIKEKEEIVEKQPVETFAKEEAISVPTKEVKKQRVDVRVERNKKSIVPDLKTLILMVTEGKHGQKDSVRKAMNFIDGMNMILSNEQIERRERIEEAQFVIDELSEVKKLFERAGSVADKWTGDKESLNAYLTIISMAVAKASGKLSELPRGGVINKFSGKYLGMGSIMAECS